MIAFVGFKVIYKLSYSFSKLSQDSKLYTVESRYLEYSISRTLDVSNKTIGPILINLHKMTTR